MRKAFLYLIITFYGPVIYSQTINLDSIFEPRLSGEIYQKRTGIRGNQFYSDEWLESDIKLCTGELVVNKFLKYNELQDEVIWMQPDISRQVRLEKHLIDEFCFRNYMGKSVRFKRIQIKLPGMAVSTDIFVEVLSERAASLYVFRNARISGSINIVEDGVPHYYETLRPQPVYILKLPDGVTVTFRRISRNVLLKSLPGEYKTTVRKLIQQNNHPLRSENDLAGLVSLII